MRVWGFEFPEKELPKSRGFLGREGGTKGEKKGTNHRRLRKNQGVRGRENYTKIKKTAPRSGDESDEALSQQDRINPG